MSDSPKKKKLLLIGWDGADWEHITPLLDEGLLPTLEKFINAGVMGNLATLQPVLSPMLWNSAATGKHAYQHGIHGFIEPDHTHGGARPFSSYSRKCKAIWNILSQVGYRSNVINWWASHPAEPINGCVVTNLFNGVKFGAQGPVVAKGTVHPEPKTKYYGQFKVFPEELTAEQLCPFVPRAAEINQAEDSRLYTLAKTLAETMTTHAVATAVMEREPWDFMAVYYTCIDHFSHAFMPFHPPRQRHIPEKDFEIFRDVVNGAYRFSDMMLQRLLDLADDDTTVILCSDHGFESRDQRPIFHPREPAGPAIWHRRYGIFAMKGPNIKRDERIYGASLIDITPTMLAALGLPIGKDMDGRPLLEVFVDPPSVETIPSWEDVEGDDGMHGGEQRIPPKDAADLLQQFVALGYVDDPGKSKEEQCESAEVESRYNLARNYMFAGKFDDALPLLQLISKQYPWETRFISQLAQCYQSAGYYRQAKQLIEMAFDLDSTRYLLVRLIWVESSIALGLQNEMTDRVLHDIETRNTEYPGVMNRLGRLYASQRAWKDAERVYEKAVQMHPENAEALQGLARIYCRQGRNQDTVDTALAAVGLIHRLPHAHFSLGIAMARSGNGERAATAFRTAIHFSPGLVSAHRWLATVLRSMLGDHEGAQHHQSIARRLLDQRSAHRQIRANRREQLFDIADYPEEDERQRILEEARPDRRDPRYKSGKEFVLVSGLPRSGTSMMMQMLNAGGLEPRTDGERKADENNPRGYYEWEAIKKLATRPALLDEEGLEQKAIKVVSALISHLPYHHNYKIVFMTRPIDEVAASQEKMLQRLGTENGHTDADLHEQLRVHRDATRSWMERNERVEWIDVDYPTLVERPDEILPQLIEFIGTQRLPTADRMVDIIDRNLYREKSQ